MLRRYELTDQEWEQIASLLPLEKTGKPGRPPRITVPCLTGWSGLHAVVLPGVTCRSVTAPGIRYTAVSASGLMTGSSIISSGCSALRPNFMSFHWMPQLFSSSTQCRSKKRGPPNEIGHSRGGASSKIHAAVDAYGYPVYLMLSEGQRNDINFAIPVLKHINIEGSNVLADRGYDSFKLIDYIYENGGEPTIPSKKGAKFERHCDWRLYKERHLVEKYFLKLKGFRRIATRYDKLAFTYMGFVCLASILIWLK